MTREDEKYCLEELARGNQQAFRWLFMEWHPKLVDFFTRLTGDGDTAYDYAQDIFYDIWKARGKFAGVESFSAYLFQMARFKVYNHFDKVADIDTKDIRMNVGRYLNPGQNDIQIRVSGWLLNDFTLE